jgi:2-haloacid dehalogenase
MQNAMPRPPRALTFDVYGTVVDWRGSIVAAARRVAGGDEGPHGKLVDAWQRAYGERIRDVNEGRRGFAPFDALLVESLDEVGAHLDDAQKRELLAAWRALAPWPDSVRGLERLRTKFWVATLSNGTVTLLKQLSTNVGLPWDDVLSAESVGVYKPRREVYASALFELGAAAGEVMMVASHGYDLAAASGLGFQTAFVRRPSECGEVAPEPAGFDRATLTCDDLLDLARRLGV